MTNKNSKTNRKNAPTTKVKQLLDMGGWVNVGAIGLTFTVFEDYIDNAGNYRDDCYVLRCSSNPQAIPDERCETIQELANAMRNVADLRTWRIEESN